MIEVRRNPDGTLETDICSICLVPVNPPGAMGRSWCHQCDSYNITTLLVRTP